MEKKSKGPFLNFWCWMGLSFVLYRVPLTFECSKLCPLQFLQPLKPLLEYWNSALGKNLSEREEKSILEDFFSEGIKKAQKRVRNSEFGHLPLDLSQIKRYLARLVPGWSLIANEMRYQGRQVIDIPLSLNGALNLLTKKLLLMVFFWNSSSSSYNIAFQL